MQSCMVQAQHDASRTAIDNADKRHKLVSELNAVNGVSHGGASIALTTAERAEILEGSSPAQTFEGLRKARTSAV